MKKAQTKEADLGNGPIGSLLFKLALPAIVAQIINVMYNMVDRMYPSLRCRSSSLHQRAN